MKLPWPFLAASLLAAPPLWADVELNAEERDRLGIQSEAPVAMQVSRSWNAAGTVIDVSPLITLVSDLAAAESAAAASRGEAERSQKLFEHDTNVARKALDSARAQAVADAGKVVGLRGQLLAGWGRTLTSMGPAMRQRLVDELLSGHASLIRAEQLVPIPADVNVASARITGLNGGSWQATSLGALPQVPGASSTGAVLLKVTRSLPAGQFVEVALVEARPSLGGLTVPQSAIIHWRGGEWVYQQSTADHFERRAVRTDARAEGRAILDDPENKRPVVTVGARMLLAVEQGASAADSAGGTPAASGD